MGAVLSPGSSDGIVRIWNADTLEQIGEALRGHSSGVLCVSESADGCHIVSKGDGNTVIRNRENRAIVWTSAREHVPRNTIDNDDAETIIRSCGQLTPRLWPNSFPVYTPELYCYDGSGFYTNWMARRH